MPPKFLFHITFTQKAVGLKDGWVDVIAHDESTARTWARGTYGDLWSGIYPEGQQAPEYYPHGCLGSVDLT